MRASDAAGSGRRRPEISREVISVSQHCWQAPPKKKRVNFLQNSRFDSFASYSGVYILRRLQRVGRNGFHQTSAGVFADTLKHDAYEYSSERENSSPFEGVKNCATFVRETPKESETFCFIFSKFLDP